MIWRHAWFAAALVGVVAVIALRANSRRSVNRALAYSSLMIVFWLVSVALATNPSGSHQFFFYRLGYALGPLVVQGYWFVIQAILKRDPQFDSGKPCRAFVGFFLPLFLAALCFTPYFIPRESTPEHRLYGWGYYAHWAGLMLYCAVVCAVGWRSRRRVSGVVRLELELWMAMGTIMSACGFSATFFALFFHKVGYLEGVFFAVILCYSITAVTTTTTSWIFDGGQLISLILCEAGRVVVVGTLSLFLYAGVSRFLVAPFPLALVVVFCLWFAPRFSRWMSARYAQGSGPNAARAGMFKVANAFGSGGDIFNEALPILRGWAQSERVKVYVDAERDLFPSTGVASLDPALMRDLRPLGWISPERLDREQLKVHDDRLSRFLADNELALAVVIESPELNFVVGFGPQLLHRPYTYPQVLEAMELCSIFGGALSRGYLAAKAQRSEQLAVVGMLGANFAHEIRNPIQSVRTLAELLPVHYGDKEFREKFFSLVGSEVARMEHLVSQLLELSTPRTYELWPMALHTALSSCLELVRVQAAQMEIEVRISFVDGSDLIKSNPEGIQHIVRNLCYNALQAVEHLPKPRWISVETLRGPDFLEVVVSDSGRGISPKVHARLFQLLQTTKPTGIGLGLAICREISNRLGTRLVADLPEPGKGAVFRFRFAQASENLFELNFSQPAIVRSSI